jgi:voltage-dependent calcium channel L type alpha-1D
MIGALMLSAKASASLSMILMLMLFIFALFGMQFFGKKIDPNDERYNYDDFLWSFVSCFVVLSGENWNALMYEASINVGRGYCIFFVLLVVMGSFVLLNLFIAIILDQLTKAVDDAGEDPEPSQAKTALQQEVEEEKAWIAKAAGRMARTISSDPKASSSDVDSARPVVNPDKGLEMAPVSLDLSKAQKPKMTREEKLREKFDYFDNNGNGWIDEKEVTSLLEFFNIKLTMMEYHIIFADDKFTFEEFMDLMDRYEIEISDDGAVTSRASSRAQKFTAAEKAILEKFNLDAEMMVGPDDQITNEIDMQGKSLFLFAPTSRFRVFIGKIAQDPKFGNFILLCIIGASITVALDEPSAGQDRKDVLKVLDLIFTIIFVVELCINVIAMGFFIGKKSYLQDSHFNKLDFIVVTISFVSLFFSSDQVSSLKALRAFRALRPLRTVGRIQSLKVVVNSLMQSAFPVLNALSLMAFFYFLFAILGVNLFAGNWHYCRTGLDLASLTPAEIATATNFTCPETNFDKGRCGASRCHKDQCRPCFLPDDGVVDNREWSNHVENFDNVLNGMVVLFEMSTMENWPIIALQAVDSTGASTWPEKDYGKFRIIYFMVFIVIGTFFIANLFASVACDKYNSMSQFYSGMLFLTEKQKVWVVDSKQVTAAKPTKIVIAPIIKGMDKLVMHPTFDLVVVGFILVNMLCLAMYYEGMPSGYELALNGLNIFFIAVFTLEMVLKVLGLGPEPYIRDHWNKFDFIVVTVSIIGLAVDVGPVTSVIRMFRIARILKLVPRAERLMSIVETVYLSLPALFNVGLLAALIFFIYACLGMSLFGGVERGEFLNEDANFDTFLRAMLTLFRASTGEAWNLVMYDTAVSKNGRNSGGAECGGDSCGLNIVAQVYWISFVIIASFVMLNLVLAAVVTQFELCKQSNDGLSNRMIENFKAAWYKFDPEACGRIQQADFPFLFGLVASSFGFDKSEWEKYMRKCEDSGGELRFSEVLFVLAFERFGTALGSTQKGRELEMQLNTKKLKLDTEPTAMQRPVLPQLTEWQVMEMSVEDLREELRKRGHVRKRNRAASEMGPGAATAHVRRRGSSDTRDTPAVPE